MFNWDHAPKEATHVEKTGSGRPLWWMLSDQGNWYFLYEKYRGLSGAFDETDDWQRIHSIPDLSQMEKRPTPKIPVWDGESIPDVNHKVEALFTSDSEPHWFEFTLLGRGPMSFFGLVKSFNSAGSPVEGTWPNAKLSDMKFRPLTTEAERKEERIIQKLSKIAAGYSPNNNVEFVTLMRRLVDDGYMVV